MGNGATAVAASEFLERSRDAELLEIVQGLSPSARARLTTVMAALPRTSGSTPRYRKMRLATRHGREMAFVDIGREGNDASNLPTLVFLHGSPTSSYMWRNVMPHCEGLLTGPASTRRRCGAS